jgi:hypothetical protein
MDDDADGVSLFIGALLSLVDEPEPDEQAVRVRAATARMPAAARDSLVLRMVLFSLNVESESIAGVAAVSRGSAWTPDRIGQSADDSRAEHPAWRR